MRVRSIGFAAGALVIAALMGFAGSQGMAGARLQEGTPAATDATPAASPAAGPVRVVTLVAWYQPDPSGEFLQVGPVRTNENLVAGPGDAVTGQLTGKANFNDPANSDLPRITLSDSVFDGYPRTEGDLESVFRWTYLNDEDQARPATVVIQVKVSKSPAYQGYTGTATFMSRAQGSGGVMVIMLNPPA